MSIKNTLKLILFAPLFFLACDNSTIFDEENNDRVGYRLDKLYFNYELPSYVNVMFQVTDFNDNGIAELKTDDFVVYEDGERYSPTESFPLIRNRENTPYSLKTVLLLDNSASVGDNLNDIKTAAITMINNVSNKQQFAIYKFSETPILVQDFTDNISDLTDAINSIQLGYATTDLYGAIIAGVTGWNDYYVIDSIQQGVLVAFTDGSDTQHSHTLTQALNAIGSKRVYTVGLGDEIDPEVLEQLGTAGFYPIDNISQVVEKFTEIQSAIVNWGNSFYWLNYMSPTRGDYTHEFKLVLMNNPNNQSDGYILDSFNSNGFYSVLAGLYINATGELPYGISSVTMMEDDLDTLEATTYLPAHVPGYTWRSTNEAVVRVTVNSADSSLAYITAVGSSYDVASIIINDSANELADTLSVTIGTK